MTAVRVRPDAAELAAAFRPVERCRGCGKTQTRMQSDGMGRLVEVPNPCRCNYWRRRNCICRVCESPVEGKPRVAIYCAEHRERARKATVRRFLAKDGGAASRRWQERNPEKKRASARAHYQNDPEKRRARNEYKREYRRQNPDKVAAARLRYTLKHLNRPDDYSKRYHREVLAGLRTPTRAPRNERGDRLCIRCERTPLAGRRKVCNACRAPSHGAR